MIESLIPATMPPPLARYAHAVLDAESGLILTSGQLAFSKNEEIPESAEEQSQMIFENIDHILAEAHSSREGVLRINAYVTDRQHMAGYMAARDSWLSTVDHLPASTLLIVSGFTKPEFVVEIEVTAIKVSAR